MSHGWARPRRTGEMDESRAPVSDVRGDSQSDAAQVFAEHRELLLGVAYRLLGQWSDAEDVVQDAWLRWAGVDGAQIVEPRAFLVRATTRLAIDRLRRVKARRESYVGPWLPEPILTQPDIAEDVERAESVSMGLLIVLETLSPLERAVFVLREAFAVPYPEIASILGRSETAIRQLASRAREHVQARRPRFESDPSMRSQVTERFLAACSSGDLVALMGTLAPGVTLLGDGGRVARAPLRPILGPDRVARFLLGILTQPLPDSAVRVMELNGSPGIVTTSGGSLIAALVLDVGNGAVQTLYLVSSPDKLNALAASRAEWPRAIVGQSYPS